MTAPEERTRIVAEWRASGLTAEQFARERGLPKTRLWAWSSRLLRAERHAVRPRDVRLAQVVRPRPPDGAATVTIEIGDARVVVGSGVDRNTLIVVLEALGAVDRTGAAKQ